MPSVETQPETEAEKKARQSALKKFLKEFRKKNISDLFEKAGVKKKNGST